MADAETPAARRWCIAGHLCYRLDGLASRFRQTEQLPPLHRNYGVPLKGFASKPYRKTK